MTSLKNISLISLMICGILQFSSQVYAQESVEKVMASTDVEATMKSMSFTYRQAMQATDPSAMHSMIDKLQQLVTSVQLVQFEPKRQTILQQGLTEVQTQLSLVQQSLGASDIKTAKQRLQKVIALKKQYHKERSPSIWRLLFGS
ncbi:cytochrome b562 [Paraglaciecola sp. L1A13]|uniref:cytochrome b562 n=1 Tax=Paraglaciecola sp. L1A13 TaxID=2686359 RepID=UPI00131A7F8D|nr:cytochrome b562 [Paraglaciecola sp. L1A13]